MVTKTQRTEIQIETHEIKVIRFRGRQFSAYCERCQATVSAFTPEQTAKLLQMAFVDVCRFVEAEKFHLVGTKRGLPFICGNSLDNKNKPWMPKASLNEF